MSVALISVTILACIAVFVLQDFPNSSDEYVAIYQAKTFLRGRLWNEPHPMRHFFAFYWILSRNNKQFGMYLPGWPLLLTLALTVKLPLFLVNPLLGTLSLFAVFLLGKRIYDEKTALLAVIIILLSSFFLINSASYFTHTPCSLFILLFVYFSICYMDGGKKHNALLSGIFWASAFMVRPYSALLSAIPIFVYFLPIMSRRPKGVLWFLVGMAPFALFLMFYNYKLMGNIFSFPFTSVPTNQRLYLSVSGIKNCYYYLRKFMLWTPPSLLIIYFVYLPGSIKKPRENIVSLFFVLFIVGYLFFPFNAGNQYGPRYYYEAFPFLILFITSRLFRENVYFQKSKFSKFVFFLFVLGLLFNIPMVIMHLNEEKKVIWERTDLYRLVKKEGIKNAIVFLKTGTGTTRTFAPLDLTRNDPDYSNDVLYAHYLYDRQNLKHASIKKELINQTLMDYYPGRNYYLYTYDRDKRKGFLEQIGKVDNVDEKAKE
ncbi:MAG: glycosyltransferase family 39 protein [Candidatus Omnitrophica bacterium]|nr:glycosyltransferase family 39 protein [Candidatus Omnitrophota bacterium]